MRHLEGSLWGIWDLHVHTPASVVNNYPGSSEDEKWEGFVEDVERLPADFKVIGINDYLSIDGYRRVLDYQRAGRMPNIELVLPVVELRLRQFAGHTQLSRINYHVVFSELADANLIEDRFLRLLRAKYQLRPDDEGFEWNEHVSPESLRELGARIRASIPEDKRGDVRESDVELAMNSINFDVDQIWRAVPGNVT